MKITHIRRRIDVPHVAAVYLAGGLSLRCRPSSSAANATWHGTGALHPRQDRVRNEADKWVAERASGVLTKQRDVVQVRFGRWRQTGLVVMAHLDTGANGCEGRVKRIR